MTWKQFWCKHFWKQVGGVETLRMQRWFNLDTTKTRSYKIVAVTYACIKCHKEKLSEERILVREES